MSRFVRLGHHLFNADLVTHVKHEYDPHREESLIRIWFISGAEIEASARALGVSQSGVEPGDAALESILDVLNGTPR